MPQGIWIGIMFVYHYIYQQPKNLLLYECTMCYTYITTWLYKDTTEWSIVEQSPQQLCILANWHHPRVDWLCLSADSGKIIWWIHGTTRVVLYRYRKWIHFSQFHVSDILPIVKPKKCKCLCVNKSPWSLYMYLPYNWLFMRLRNLSVLVKKKWF